MRLLIRAAALLCALAAPAAAHDQWGDGGPVPAWVKAACCGPRDVHWYKPEAVRVTPDGYELPNYPVPITKGQALPSPSNDGLYWAFFSEGSYGSPPVVFCFFVPPMGV